MTAEGTRHNYELAVGGRFTCMDTFERPFIKCMGSNDHQQCDIPGGGLTHMPAGVSSGSAHVCTVQEESLLGVVCWGANTSGQTEVGMTSGPYSRVACGFQHTCAVNSHKQVECWG